MYDKSSLTRQFLGCAANSFTLSWTAWRLRRFSEKSLGSVVINHNNYVASLKSSTSKRATQAATFLSAASEVSRLKKQAQAELWPCLLLWFSKRPQSQACSVKLNILLQTSGSTPSSSSFCLFHSHLCFSPCYVPLSDTVTNNCPWVQSSFAAFSCVSHLTCIVF